MMRVCKPERAAASGLSAFAIVSASRATPSALPRYVAERLAQHVARAEKSSLRPATGFTDTRLGRDDGTEGAGCGGARSGVGLRSSRLCRRPCGRPFQGTAGPGTTVPPGATTAPASRSCTYVRSGAFVASFARLGHRATRSACHCAVVARQSRLPPRVAAFRRSSREMVEAALPTWRATSHTPCPLTRSSAIASRSANDRKRSEIGFRDGARCGGAIPPIVRNHRARTGCETPQPIAAPSLERLSATNAQNLRRCPCRVTGGRSGDLEFPRKALSERHRPALATALRQLSRRPLDPAQYTSEPSRRPMARHGIVCSMSRLGNVWDNAAMESFFSSPKTEQAARRTCRTRDETRADVFDDVGPFHNAARRHSTLGCLGPVEFENRAKLAERGVHQTGSGPI